MQVLTVTKSRFIYPNWWERETRRSEAAPLAPSELPNQYSYATHCTDTDSQPTATNYLINNMATKARAFQLACRARANQASPAAVARSYATQSTSSSNPSSRRRSITVTSDDGRYNWSELSRGEKAARSTQQTANFLLVAAGLTGTVSPLRSRASSRLNANFSLQCLVSYFLYQELFAPDSKTVQFNHAVDRIKSSPECRDLLGPSRKIIAYGEPTSSKWARARPLAYSTEVDRLGTTHFKMHFNVEGPKGKGVVNVHMTKPASENRLEYVLLSLNVMSHELVYLENTDAKKGVKGKAGKMFGVQWR